MILIAASNKDPASLNIAKHILRIYPFTPTTEKSTYTYEQGEKKVKLVILDYETVYAQDIAEHYKPLELVVFVSRHSSTSGTPTLSVHTPGNLGEALLGGIPRKVSIAPANAMRRALKIMAELVSERNLNYDVSYECTHHGPSLDLPAMFAELGSTHREWEDLEAAEVVARAAMEAATGCGNNTAAALGVGGPHYNGRFTRMALDDVAAFGHIIPKYAISQVDEYILKQCVERTLEKVEFAVLDWKGVKSKDKHRIVKILEEIGLQFRKV
ncbi:MAG: D-aminoacyl-tRNA deacylase [Candidatus Bathyarchaeia archaeon]